jgi:hypothetical protein
VCGVLFVLARLADEALVGRRCDEDEHPLDAFGSRD